MEWIATLRNLQGKILLIFLFLPFLLEAQILKKDSIVTTATITAFSTDRSGNIFISLEGGTITKYSPELDSILSYSPQKNGEFSLLEAWHGFKIFGYRKNYQEFYIFDRFLTRDTRYDLDKTGGLFANLATFSSEQNLWVIEESEFRLYKVNLKTNELILSVPLEQVIGPGDHNFTFIREYQNLLFLADTNTGIYIFDNLGNYLKNMPVPGISQFSFKNKEILFIEHDKLHLRPLYQSGDKAIDLGLSQGYSGVLVSGEQIVLVAPHQITLCSLD